ncbi:MAG: myo-inosose-2 dehydratase [Proteobacteria bacterium]|nr:myo-inosose-2 dehydratase [Pseudomonadota bacterium]
MRAKLGISPIAWWNDDDVNLSDDVSLEEALRQASVAGFVGMETGQRFPMNMQELGPILDKYNIQVCGGWFSGDLLTGDIEREKERIEQQLQFFKAADAPCIVYGEVSGSVQSKRDKALSQKPVIDEAEMALYGRKVSDFAEYCEKQGMPLSYHHHMGAVVENETELDLLMKHSSIPLLFDAGHMAFAGGDNMRVIDNHHKRITHVHTKDVRKGVMQTIDKTQESFLDAVVKGVFTVPGDGDIDFTALVRQLAGYDYEGWFVVEAEQDPKQNPPLEMACLGHRTLQEILTGAGYQIET